MSWFIFSWGRGVMIPSQMFKLVGTGFNIVINSHQKGGYHQEQASIYSKTNWNPTVKI